MHAILMHLAPIHCSRYSSPTMLTTLPEIANAVKNLSSNKWYWDRQYFALKIGVSQAVVDEFIKRMEKGGYGVRSDGTWQANPSPYDNTIDFTIPKDNILGLHYSDIHDKSTREAIFAEPSPSVIGHPRRYFRIGQINNQNKAISAKIQREIVQYITGTHRALLKHYPKTAESRRETWRSWIDDGASANHYQQIHLPYIVTYFKDVWDTKFKEGDPLTPSILDKVKSEIVEMLVRMFIISDSKLEEYTRRRSVRNRSAIDAERDVEIVPRRIKRKRLTSTTISSPESPKSGVDGDSVDESDPNASTLRLFNLGELKQRWLKHEYEEVGRREIVLLNARAGKDSNYANMEIARRHDSGRCSGRASPRSWF